MRTAVLASFALAGLAGCATSAPSAPAPSELTNVQLCEAFFYAGEQYAAQAAQEATNRGVRCVEYRDAVAQYRQGREAARQQAMREALVSRPPPVIYHYQPVQPMLVQPPLVMPAPMPQPIHCTTQRVFNQIETTCR
jgi:hypothetical protein